MGRAVHVSRYYPLKTSVRTLKPTLNPNFCAFVGSRVAPPCAHARPSWRCEGHRSRPVRRPSATAAWGFTPCRFTPNDRKSRLHHSDSGEHRRTRMHAVSTWRASRGAEHAPLGAIQAQDVRGPRPGRGGAGESGGDVERCTRRQHFFADVTLTTQRIAFPRVPQPYSCLWCDSGYLSTN